MPNAPHAAALVLSARVLSALVLSALVLASATAAQEDISDRAPIALAPHAELSARLAALAAAHPDLATLVPVGTSREGRAIEALRLAAGEVAPGRPAILLVANVDGVRVFSSAVALDHAAELLRLYGTDAQVTRLLERVTLYVLPRANPDVAERRFASPLVEREGTGRGVDDDRDGRGGEDGWSDVDGDGLVTWMRVPDPDGEWTTDEHDERALVRADATLGETGRYRLEREGRDADGDERAAEDPEGDTHVNANFASGWPQHEPRAGEYPTDEPEAKALCDFVIAHPDVALVVAYGALDNLVKTPKTTEEGRRRRAYEPGLLEADGPLVERIGETYRDVTKSEAASGADGAGTFQLWCYDHRGLLTLAACLWELPTKAPKEEKADEPEGADDPAETDPADSVPAETEPEDADPPETDPEDSEPAAEGEEPSAAAGAEQEPAPEPKKRREKPSDDAGRLAWIDATGASERFVAWSPFEHPELGPVEIGGFAPYALHEPPADARTAIADAHLRFLVALEPLVARLAIAEAEATSLGGDLWRVRAVVANEGYLPLATAAAGRTRTVRPARVHLVLPTSATLLAGVPRTLVEELGGSGERRELEWIVRTPSIDAVRISLDSDHAGAAERTVTESTAEESR